MSRPDCLPPPQPLGDSHYRQIIASAIDFAIITFAEDGCITSWNRGAERVLGWTAQEMVGQPIHMVFTPEDVAAGVVDRELQEARDQPKAIDDRWHRRKGGGVFWASGETMPLIDEAGRSVGFVKIVRDLTEQLQHAKDLEFVARASESLAGESDEPILINQVAGMAVEHYAQLCAIDLSESGGRLRRIARRHRDPQRLTQLHQIDQRYLPEPGLIDDICQRALGGPADRVTDLQSIDLERWVPAPERRQDLRALGVSSFLVAPIKAMGETLGVIFFARGGQSPTFRDSDLKLAMDLARRVAVALQNFRLLQALRDADRTKDVFMATLAHELRNPLAPIANGLSIIRRAPGDPARVEQICAMIERQVRQLVRLVDDLLDVSRIANGKLQLKKESVSLVSVLGAAVEMSRPHIEAAHHQLVLDFTSEPALVMADPARLAQVFTNLLNNAAKYTGRGGRIEVSVQSQQDEVQVLVRDNGAGIEPQMLRQVFGLFTQVSPRDDHRAGGLGIGLSLVEGLVRLHGGRVEARSAGLGQGSEFVVHLPRLAPAPRVDLASVAPAAGEGGHPPRRVLVVDDNVDAATMTADLLAMSGSEVDVVHDGRAAVDHTASFRPDVVLLDIGLPDISGYEAARRIRQLQGVRQPQLIALTGWGQQTDKEQAEQAGFDQHWTKPVDPLRLLSLASLSV